MKLFIKDHLDIVLLNILNFLIILTIFYLSDGNLTFKLSIYMLLLLIITIFIFLSIRYYRKSVVYKTLSENNSNLKNIKKKLEGKDLFSDSFIKHDNQNYYQFLQEIENYKTKNSEWKTYIIQWVHQMKSSVSSIRLYFGNNKVNKENMLSILELDEIDKQLNNILNLARLEAVEKDLKIEPINLFESVNKIINQNKRMFIFHEVFPKINCEKNNITILSDKKWIEFVIDQLIHNSIKFSAPNSKVIVNIAKKNEKYFLEIKDEGMGISEEDIPRIFDLYFTGKNGRSKNSSSGIGLYLVRQILSQLGHEVEVNSKQNEGSKFTIFFR